MPPNYKNVRKWKLVAFHKTIGDALFDFIKHGPPEHQEWLAEAIEAFRLDRKRPEPR